MFGLLGGFSLSDLIFPLLVGVFYFVNDIIRMLFPAIFNPTGMM